MKRTTRKEGDHYNGLRILNNIYVFPISKTLDKPKYTVLGFLDSGPLPSGWSTSTRLTVLLVFKLKGLIISLD